MGFYESIFKNFLWVDGDSDDIDDSANDDDISLHDSHRPIYLHIITVTTTPGEGAADHAQCFNSIRRAVRVRNIADRLNQWPSLVVLAQFDFDLGLIAVRDQSDPVSAGVDVQVHCHVLHEVKDPSEVGVPDTPGRVGKEHDVRLARAIWKTGQSSVFLCALVLCTILPKGKRNV